MNLPQRLLLTKSRELSSYVVVAVYLNEITESFDLLVDGLARQACWGHHERWIGFKALGLDLLAHHPQIAQINLSNSRDGYELIRLTCHHHRYSRILS